MARKDKKAIWNLPSFLMGASLPTVLLGAACVVIAILVLGIATLCINLNLSVNGGTEPLELVYGKDTYVEQGATATANGENLEVSISGSVDTNKLGTYVIKYKAHYLWVFKTVKREVRVVDKTAPVITLNKVPGYMTPPGEQYQEEGYSAMDDYDGDLTAKVQIRTENDVVYYTVEDSSGNKTTVQREIVRQDQVSPELTLKGESTITIDAGTAYTEPGYTAMDNIDGNITDRVEISGSVNIYHADTYKLIYSVKDSSGNVTTVERTVIVKPIKQPSKVNPDGKVIYLTFDDGPSRYTSKLLDLMGQYNAKGTFFVVNTGYNMSAIFNTMIQNGHSIGIHSTTHVYKEIYASEEAYFNDLYNMQSIVKKATGVTTTLVRFPGGTSNDVSAVSMKQLTQAVTDLGFQYFDWHIDSNDWRLAGVSDMTNEEKAAQVAATVIAGIQEQQAGGRSKIVVLQHDLYSYSVDAVEQIIIWGLQNGYTFQALNSSSPTCHHTPRK